MLHAETLGKSVMLAQRLPFGIRQQLSAAFLTITLLIIAFAGFTVRSQFETVQRAAVLEAEHVGNMIAYAALDSGLERTGPIQDYLEHLNALYQREVLIVDANKNIAVSTDKGRVGHSYSDDPDNQVGATIQDGKVRTFTERHATQPQGARHIVLPLLRSQRVGENPVVGAVVLEYSVIYEGLLQAEIGSMYLIGLSGGACALLAALFGLRVASHIARRLGKVQLGVSAIAAGNYKTRVNLKRQDEIGKLGDAFNAMAAELEASHDALVAHGHELEARVATRTQELSRSNAELRELNTQLSSAQVQLVQSEKMASIGQLAAGVAHEINNPVGYVFSNFGTLEEYMRTLLDLLSAYQAAEGKLDEPAILRNLQALREQAELDFIREDSLALLRESKEGLVRVRTIVQDLKDFSRVDHQLEWQCADIHHGIDATLNIINNEIKYHADVVKQFGRLPDIECVPSQINQVIMNLVVNASHAMGEARGQITIRTSAGDDSVTIEIADNGAGISPEHLSHIFEPFFTTKAIGKGTGLGLSISYGIIKKHGGSIEVDSELGQGTAFRIILPIRQSHADDATPAPASA